MSSCYNDRDQWCGLVRIACRKICHYSELSALSGVTHYEYGGKLSGATASRDREWTVADGAAWLGVKAFGAEESGAERIWVRSRTILTLEESSDVPQRVER